MYLNKKTKVQFNCFSEGKNYNAMKHCEQHNQKNNNTNLQMLVICINKTNILSLLENMHTYTNILVF